jgi:betaine reductase
MRKLYYVKHSENLFTPCVNTKGEVEMDNWLKGKTAIIIGERDGVQGPSIAKCIEAAGANVVYAVTECFV